MPTACHRWQKAPQHRYTPQVTPLDLLFLLKKCTVSDGYTLLYLVKILELLPTNSMGILYQFNNETLHNEDGMSLVFQ